MWNDVRTIMMMMIIIIQRKCNIHITSLGFTQARPNNIASELVISYIGSKILAMETSGDWTLRFKGNSTKQWDGKEVFVEGDWTQELYPEVVLGSENCLLWNGKGATIAEWKAIVVEIGPSEKPNDVPVCDGQAKHKIKPKFKPDNIGSANDRETLEPKKLVISAPSHYQLNLRFTENAFILIS